ncbi:MAG: synaptobrevin-B [Lachnospira sp.]|nr:synaptobrevin-B [Lachnospira sp.]
MINFNSKKNKKILLSLVIVLVLAMIVPMLVSAVSAFM